MAATVQPRTHPRTIGWLGTVSLAMGGSNQSLFLMGALLLAQGSAAVPLLVVGLLLSWAALPGWTELILMWPNRVGGIAATCAEAFRPYSPVLANLTGVSYWWGWIPTCGLTALLSSEALHEWFLPGVSVTVLAIAIVLVFTAVNLVGVRWATRVAIPVACLSFLLASLSVLIPVIAGTVDWDRATSFHLTLPFDGAFGAVTSAMAGLYLIGFAAPAFEAAACHVGETIDPVRTVPKAMYRAAGVASLYFIAVPIVWLGVIGPAGLEGDLMHTLGPTFAPLFGGFAKAAAVAFMVFNMFHGTLQPLAGAARTMSQLSEDGLLPVSVARRNRFDAPWVATSMTAGFAICFLLLGDPTWIIAAANFCYLIGIGMPSVAVWLLRRNAPEMERPYRAPRGTVTLGAMAAGVWLVATFLGLQQFGLPTVIASLGMAYSGSVAYAWRRYQDTKGDLEHRGDFLRSLHAKLTGAMLAVIVLDGVGYLLAVSHIGGDHMALVAVLEDIFVAVAILTVTVGLVLPGVISHSVHQIAQATGRLADGTIADLTAAMRALARGQLDQARADPTFSPIDVRSRDEVGQMALAFNVMQRDLSEAALALDGAREGVRADRAALARGTERQALIAELGQRALQAPGLDELIQETLERARNALGADAMIVTECEPDGESARIGAAVGLKGDPIRLEKLEGAGFPERIAALTPGFAAFAVSGRDSEFGWVSAHWRHTHAVGRDERDFIQAVANLLSNAVDHDQAERDIRYQALHDPLTSLPNRALFVDRLEHALGRLSRSPGTVAVLFLDCDHFKIVNDSLGHAAGDELLTAVAHRLLLTLRPGETVARFGGDEFVIICDQLQKPSDAETIARRTIAELGKPFVLAGVDHVMSASVGIALAVDAPRPAEDLLREADAAMYRAKERGRGRYELYDAAMHARALARLRTETELRAALGNDQLRLYYQPIVDLADGRANGVEALLRWEHPERGLVPPGEFIGVAEETGVIVELGEWVLHEGCREIVAWHRARPDDEPVRLSVNLSARQVAHSAIVETVERAISATGIDPAALTLEITESVLMADPEASAATLLRLKALGVEIALDDFGTGYSSLAYLRRFPIDVIKIDREFVGALATDTAIVEAVLGMGRNMGLRVVAEGVETAEQEAALVAMGCRLAQGYRYARPCPADAARLLVTRQLPVSRTPAELTGT